MNNSEKALIRKDMKEITGSKQVLLPMTIVPLVMVIVLPTILILIAHLGGGNLKAFNGIEGLLKKLPFEYRSLTPGQLILNIGINYMFPSFFLLIPIMASGILGASSFVGEKEHKTMETLLYTPVSMEQLLRAKILGVFLASYIIALASFLLLGTVINIGGILEFGKLIFPNVEWLIIIFWLTPGLTLFSLTFTVLVSAKSSTFQEAQQVSALLVLPIILMVVGQMSGLFLVNNLIVFIIGALLLLLNYFFIKRIARKFVAEKLL